MRRVRTASSFAGLLVLSAAAAFAVAEHVEIRVKLLDAHSGKPYAGRAVNLFGATSRSGGLHPEDTVFDVRTKTDPDGVAHFRLNAPLPYRLLLYCAQNGGCAQNGAPPMITEDVVRSGWVGPNTCARKNQAFRWQDVKPEPGEIILFVVEPPWP